MFVVEEHGDLGGGFSGDADGCDEDRVGADAVEDGGAVAVEDEAGTGVFDVGGEDDGCPVTRDHAGCDLCLGLEFDVATHHDVRGEAEHWVLTEATVEQRFVFVEEVCDVVGPGGEQSDCFVGIDVRDSFEVFDAVNSAADDEHAGIGEVVAGPEFEHDRSDPCLDVHRRSGHCQRSDCFEVDE
ncbi:MAG: hypothetical protein Q8M22_02790 [Actinomycetota bacterium]|nr:hypothetical protein [Actinomycetota bacterium]